MSETRLAEWLKSIEGLAKTLLTASGALLAIYASVQGKLVPVAEYLGVQKDMAQAAGWVGSLLLVLPFLWFLVRSYRRFAKASRLEQPDRFTLSATTPESLIGRSTDLEKLLDTVRRNRVVLLDGESGCGKSALVAAGLVPRLTATTTELLPALMRDWGDDWVRGPLASALGALFDVLTQEQRLTLGWTSSPDLAADASTLAADLAKRLDAVRTQLGRRLLLIADQFDDYQARHRERFIDAGGNWLKPDALVAANPFWALTCSQLRAGALHLLVVARADTASGLSCVRFVEEAITADRHLPRVDMEFLRPLLERIAPADAVPAVVSHPDQGWWELRDRLEVDLKLQGAVLMQQVRTVLLGLRQLPMLNVATYLRAGGLRGTESRVVTRAVQRVSEALGGGEAKGALVRRVLASLVLPGSANQAAKAQRASFEDLVSLAGNTEITRAMLLHLQAEEVVCPATDGAWKLDHDYLANAVLEDAKQADRWGVALREGLERYRHGGNAWRARWTALLSSRLQARLIWECARGRLRYGDAAGYARLSLCKPLAVAVALGTLSASLTASYQNWQLSLEAARIYDQFGGQTERMGVLAAWQAPPVVRERLYRLVHENVSRLNRAILSGWPLAHGGLETATLQQSAQELLEPIAQADNLLIGFDLVKADKSVANRLLAPSAVRQEAISLRDRLTRESDHYVVSRLVEAYTAFAAKITDPSVIQQEARALQARLAHEANPRLAAALTKAYVAVSQLSAPLDIQQVASALRERLAIETNVDNAFDLADAYADVAAKLSAPSIIQQEARELRARLTHEANPLLVAALARAYAGVAAQLSTPSDIRQAASTLLDRLTDETDSFNASRLAEAYATVATKLTAPSDIEQATAALQIRLVRRHTGLGEASRLARAYTTVAAKLSGQFAIQQQVAVLRKGIENTSEPVLGDAYATVAAKLADPSAIQLEATAMRESIARNIRRASSSILVPAFAVVAIKLSDPTVIQQEAASLRESMQHLDRSSDASRLAKAYATVVSKLADPLVIQQEAAAMRERLAQETDGFVAPHLADAYAAIAAKLSDSSVIQQEAAVLRERVLRKHMLPDHFGPQVASSLGVAYAAAAAKLSDTVAIREAAAALRERLAAETNTDDASRWAQAYAAVAARIVGDAIGRKNVTTTKEEVQRILAMAGHPYLYDSSSLLVALRPASGRDFGKDLGAAVAWWSATYKGDPATLRPMSLAAP